MKPSNCETPYTNDDKSILTAATVSTTSVPVELLRQYSSPRPIRQAAPEPPSSADDDAE